MKFHDKEEQELIKSIETEAWVSVNNLEEEIKKAKKAAEATHKKSERMNIRISPNDLRRLKIKAMEEGMPYQTLVSSIIHKYLIGRLQEQREQKDS
ncbi:MAG: antitoxin [Desulfobacterales bacterium]|jgi:predicted DNA binding CopG/RHH family protein